MSVALLASVTQASLAASLGADGYRENFDSMGVLGVSPPEGWSLWVGEAGSSRSSWTESISANGPGHCVANMRRSRDNLLASNAPYSPSHVGYNAAFAVNQTRDRVLATSPTVFAGMAWQLELSNASGQAIEAIQLSYDTRRFTVAAHDNELPGYQLFFSLDGRSWNVVQALIPNLDSVPNTVGVTPIKQARIDLGGRWAPNAVLLLRWVDDNAEQSSPDQIIGLNNVEVQALSKP
ncbi:hypothetical protein [Paucibacter sp. Y2R2-4]|uniref:hypothetical protein n=1 Tax=Paucibacter sp. Y2R2-4 TaxID=2893553 RepID=UPI0021E440DC|nr:hypothetical protein [Paucibacter sp. Y2R2-4]MCV2351205.1 hypothetical protein [Paucibacter sp. Y2R2-4]